MIENYSEIKSLLDRVFALLQEESWRSQQTIARLEKRIEALERQLSQQKTDSRTQDSRLQSEPMQQQAPLVEEGHEEEILITEDADTIMEVEDDFWEVEDEHGDDAPECQWMTDFPGERVEDVRDAVSFSDRIYFIRELFMEDEEQYEFTLDRINETRSFAEVVSEMRAAFEWDENSDEVYRFYMAVRRRFE